LQHRAIDGLLRRFLALRRNRPAAYATAVIMVAVALVLRLVLAPVEPGLLPYITFFPAVSLAAMIGGAGPGMMAALICAALAWRVFLPAEMQLGSSVIYLADGVLIALAAHVLHRSLDRLQTAKEEAEAARRAADEASAAKSAFLAAVSHDLRQPVQAMRLFHTVMAEQAGPDLAPVVVRMGQALTSGEELLAGIVELSVLETGQVTATSGSFAVGEALAEVIADCAPAAAAANLRLRWVPSSVVLVSDRVLFKRMVRNLVMNAIRYTRRGGIVVGCRHRNGGLMVQVVDSGIGIPLDRQKMIFEAFYQLGNPARDRSKGLGLGLAIVQRLGALLGYPVSVCSQVGKGSVFSIEVATAQP
jgi:signal transduction histidine kinase